MPVLKKHHLPHHKKYGNPKGLPTAQYTVVKPVLNLHIAGVQVAEGQTLTLTEAAARHWLREGVLAPVSTQTPPAASDPASES